MYPMQKLKEIFFIFQNAVKHPSSESIKKEGTKSLTPQPRGLALPSINTINLF